MPENAKESLDKITEDTFRFIQPIRVREEIQRFSDAIAKIQSQNLYDLDADDIISRSKGSSDMRYEYGLLVDEDDTPVAVTSLKLQLKEESENQRKEWDYIVPQNDSSKTYTVKKLKEITDFTYPYGEITGLSRDKTYKGRGIGKKLSDIFTEYVMDEQNQERLGYDDLSIIRVSKGFYSGTDERYRKVVEDIKSKGVMIQKELEEKGVPGLPYVHPASKKAAQAALQQDFKPICASSRNGGPLWVHKKDRGENIRDFVLLGEKDGTYSRL